MRPPAAPRLAARACAPTWICCALLVGACGDDPQPVPDGRITVDGGVARDGTPPAADRGGGGGGFTESVQRACGRILAGCQQQADPMGQPWSATIVPWTQQACEQMVQCFVEKTTDKCYERLAGYYTCVEKSEPFACNGCLNAWQYIQGACPCLKECNPACP